jgi:hypothetical protein
MTDHPSDRARAPRSARSVRARPDAGAWRSRSRFLGVAALLLAACAAPFKGEVTTFHEWKHPHGDTIRIVPLDERKLGSLEFREYAGLVAERLQQMGYSVVGEDESSQFVAQMDYFIDTGRTEIQTWPSDAVWYHFSYGHYRDPFYYGVGYWGPEVYSYTVYTRSLSVVIRSTPDGGPGTVVYEGRVHSVGASHRLEEIMPYMVTAMFTNFPGESGLTKIVTVETDSGD